MSKRMLQILDTFDENELAFFYVFKLDTYTPHTQGILNEYYRNRGLRAANMEEIVRNKKFRFAQSTGYHCSRCGSSKLLCDDVEITTQSDNTSALDGLSGRASYGKRIVCMVCDYYINDPNREKSYESVKEYATDNLVDIVGGFFQKIGKLIGGKSGQNTSY